MNHKNKLVEYLLIMLLTFSALFIISFIDELNNTKIFNLNLGVENYLVMLLSLLSIIKVLFDLESV